MGSTETPQTQPGAPDVMNDPAFDTNSKGKQKSVDEPDTCRICRGEGSEQEPLFYPCKCSGSIKFVHQNCLMEWLSHSQKKHCELCKTPFRFTKLYHPHMPNSVPLPVFLRQAAIHSWKSFLTWSRFHLVIFVWVAWLPWCMRTVFRGLFWIADGGWINWQETQRWSALATKEHLEKLAKEGTTPATQGFFESRDAAASAVVSHMAKALPHIFSPLAPSRNVSEPSMLRLVKSFFQGVISRSSREALSSNPAVNSSVTSVQYSRSSWLSNFSFLNSLTRSPTLNNILIDTLEGQLITLVVVISFILIFLIREWVVQQQPGMDMGAGVQADAAAARQGEDVPMLQQLARQHAEQRLRRGAQGELPAGGDNEPAQMPEPPRRARVMARPRPRRPIRAPSNNDRDPQDMANTTIPESDAEPTSPTPESSGTTEGASFGSTSGLSSSLQQRPGMPGKDTLDTAAEIRRTIDEQSQASGHSNWPGVKVFMELWDRAERKPSEVLKIIEEEGRNEELSWIVAAMKRLEGTSSFDDTHHSGSVMAEAFNDSQDDLGHSAQQGTHQNNTLRKENTAEPSETVNVINVGTLKSLSDPEKAANEHDSSQFYTEDSRTTGPGLALTPGGLDRESQRQSAHPDFSWPNIPLAGEPDAAESSKWSGEPSEHLYHTLPNDENTVERNNSPFHPDYVEDGSQNTSGAIDQSGTTDRVIASIGDRDRAIENLQGEGVQAESGELAVQDAHSETAPDAKLAHQSLLDKVMDWLWGDLTPVPGQVEQARGDDEHVVDDLADEAPFVPIEHGQPVIEDANIAANPGRDPEVVAAAVQAGLDPNQAEAVEDGEDLEGIMELVGMQGPLAGLIQNGMFCAVLVSLTIFFGTWIPYIAGKIFLVFLANPVLLLIKLPLRWTSTCADLIIDMCVFSAGLAYYWVDTVVRFLCAPIGWAVPVLGKLNENKILADFAKSYAESALERLANTFIETGGSFSESDIPTFSILAHESLRVIQRQFIDLIKTLRDASVAGAAAISTGTFGFAEFYEPLSTEIAAYTKNYTSLVINWSRELLALVPSILKINPLRVSLTIPKRTRPLDLSLAYWDSKDRVLAILFGYLFFSLIGLLYLRISAIVRGTKADGKVQGALADVLYQAGGVLKVILIISIEMIAFPLYCGLLLDLALLPLFGKVTVMSRLGFTLNSPYTSIFVHWFIGTCYMFHFALFVSMCRKIMRSGVLCRYLQPCSSPMLTFRADFIRDPDDPTFHPVRDVLERSVSTQLRKIAFSALVYGALVILCLGGVVWGIYFAFDNVFPIYWSSNEPVLEFPVDLLFYNFLMPVAVRFFRPSQGLNKMYSWWFRRCARALRLSHFLFGERREDEEGHHVRRTWSGLLCRKHGDIYNPVTGSDSLFLAEDCDRDAMFLRDGCYVRAPASDQVRIPKGAPTFLEVDESNQRIDGQPDSEQGLHGQKSDMFSKVYIPPLFRLRVGTFIFLIWLFAATTGICITILPLVFGRLIFAYMIPNHIRMNDIYAFSIGIYFLGGLAYILLHYYHILSFLRSTVSTHQNPTMVTLFKKAVTHTVRLFRLTYTYFFFAFLLPSLSSLLIEFYFTIPLHTYFGNASDRHIIYFIQDWTLGVLYVKMAGRLILWNTNSRPATALRGVVRNGWLDPDARLATRAFIFPSVVLLSTLLTTPLGLGYIANSTIFSGAEASFQNKVYRYSYPGILGIAAGGMVAWAVARAFRGWRQRIRDEVYLIGERLHNFGERKVQGRGRPGRGRQRVL